MEPQPTAEPADNLKRRVAERIVARNPVSRVFFDREADRLARACREMAERFLRGGRLLAFGNGHCATDAQHVSVEFVHPVIVGKRALPALDLSLDFRRWLPAVLRPDDVVMGFAPPGGDPEVAAALADAAAAGAQTFALPGAEPGSSKTGRDDARAAGARSSAQPGADAGDDDATSGAAYAVAAPSDDPFIAQELIEILYHTLWETVHVFFEHRELGHDVGAAEFLYPFLGRERQDTSGVVDRVAASIRAKAEEDEKLRDAVAAEQAGAIAAAVRAIRDRLDQGGTLILFGNGGSATDANDWALDAAIPLGGELPIPAISLAMEPANLSAIANDVGAEAIFLRQLIAQLRPVGSAVARAAAGGPENVAIGISTSGGSANVLAAFEEARKHGLLTLALLGYDGGEVVRRGLADHAIVVRCDYIPRIQEIQATIYHVMLETLRELRR